MSSNIPSVTAEDAGGAPDSIPPPIAEESEVIFGRRLQTDARPEKASPPLPRVLSLTHQALRETEAAILREWEALETEHQRLSNWCTQLEEHTKAASCQFASERSELEQEREDLKEDLEKVFEREREVTREEKRLVKKKEHLDQREVVITEFHEKLKAYNVMLEKERDEQTATEAALQKLWQELDDRASNISLAEENLKAKDASLEEWAMDLVRQEKDLAWREEIRERREKLLAEHELEAEEKEKKLEEKERTLEERVHRFQATQAAQVAQTAQAAPGSPAVEAMKKTLEDLRAEHRIGVQRITAWANEASSALVPLGVSPIPVSKQSVSIFDALPMLDSVADRLRCLDQILGTRLEVERAAVSTRR
jgi:DNA repair exonuclease SbcCD ATPase subunit